MADLTLWEPLNDLMTMRDWMDRFIDRFWGRDLIGFGMFETPPVDMYQTEDEVIVKATIPGVKPEDLQISVAGDVLTIRGEVKQEEETKNKTYHLRERRYGTFSRSFPLPTAVVADKAHAEFENGILTLVLPKAEEVRPKTITVKAK